MKTLYNTSVTTNKTKVWKVRTEGNIVYVSHGFLNGKMIEHQEICEGKNIGKKNETTPEQQAIAVAQSLWDKKVKTGYSTEIDFTDHSTYFPMLASEISEKLIEFPCYVQPKLDGIRCLIYMKDGEVFFQSRNHSLFQPFPHLLNDIYLLFALKPTNLKLILDGELYSHDLTFQQITSIVRKKDHPDLSKIQYHLYDLYLPDIPYNDRLNLIRQLTKNNTKQSTIKVVSTTMANNREELEEAHTRFVENDYEGLMARMPSGLYRPQIRSKELLKYKHFKDDEFIVIGHHIGNGGIPIFECVNSDGNKFSVNMKCSLNEKKEYMENVEKYYGKLLTVRYQELSDDGIPRFPVGIGFRIDN